MRVFMSWSGERSKSIASALTEWIQMVVQSAEPWMSDRDLAKGSRSIVELGTQLEKANVGIVCLTPENIAEQWINFEAGALSKSYGDAKVWTYLYELDHTQVTGPLAQFQHTKADRSDTLKLVMAINESSEKKMDPPRLEKLFEAMWPQLEERLKNIRPISNSQPTKRTAQDIAEENLEVTRGLVKAVESLRAQVSEREEKLRHDTVLKRWKYASRELAEEPRESRMYVLKRLRGLENRMAELREYIAKLEVQANSTRAETERAELTEIISQSHKELNELIIKAKEMKNFIERTVG